MNQTCNEQVELVNRQIKEIFGVYREAIKQLGISESEFWIWHTLVKSSGEYTQQDICNIWSLPKQTVNTVIKQMRWKKFAYLEAIPGTRNHKVIHLTESGRAHGERLIQPFAQAEENTLSKISPDTLALVTDILGKYTQALRGSFFETAKAQKGRI